MPDRADYHHTTHRLEKKEILTKLLSVCNVTFRLMGNKQGEPIQTTVSAVNAVNVLTDQRGVRVGLFLKPFAKHLSAFSNMRKKWCQFHFALASQIRDHKYAFPVEKSSSEPTSSLLPVAALSVP